MFLVEDRRYTFVPSANDRQVFPSVVCARLLLATLLAGCWHHLVKTGVPAVLFYSSCCSYCSLHILLFVFVIVFAGALVFVLYSCCLCGGLSWPEVLLFLHFLAGNRAHRRMHVQGCCSIWCRWAIIPHFGPHHSICDWRSRLNVHFHRTFLPDMLLQPSRIYTKLKDLNTYQCQVLQDCSLSVVLGRIFIYILTQPWARAVFVRPTSLCPSIIQKGDRV